MTNQKAKNIRKLVEEKDFNKQTEKRSLLWKQVIKEIHVADHNMVATFRSFDIFYTPEAIRVLLNHLTQFRQ